MHPLEPSQVELIEQLNQTAWEVRVNDSTHAFELCSKPASNLKFDAGYGTMTGYLIF